MPKKPETPFNKVMMTGSNLRLYVEHGEAALKGQSPQDFAAEVQEAYQYLLDFRNIVNGMASLDQPPKDAAKIYAD